MAAKLTSHPAGPLSGKARVPGDKSISHRALMLGALAVGETEITGLLEGDDVMRTARAVRALGAEVERGDDGAWRVHGVGVGGLAEPAETLDMGNAGTGARLLMGVVATHPMTCQFTGDASLRARPMGRVAEPLERMGARIIAREGCRLPLTVVGGASPLPIEYRLPAPSAQVKSAVLLAGLNAPGETTVVEPEATRDHTERLLRHFGAELRVEAREDGARAITVVGQPELAGRALAVPGDPSAAAFLAVAALLVPGSSLNLERVGVNPLRTGLYVTLREMGAELAFTDEREESGEPVADIEVRASALRGVEVPAGRAPTMIDEYPVLAVAAACAKGTTVMRGLAELRLKESDRVAAIARALAACGVGVEAGDDYLVVEGCGGPPPGGATVEARLDHRIAMAFLVLGAAARRPVAIDDGAPIATSFPGFVALCNGAGAEIA
ncbi:MAG: 3-phosphoshikimate 1-carboxyvinyltransferase [Proteobacteria bacterium]|nr:3-phosphoshikimate 1-carboxyvinyltransferase [Pseudomonadota bacterium]